MSKRDIGQEILDGIRDVKAYKAGTKVLRVHALKEPAPPQKGTGRNQAQAFREIARDEVCRKLRRRCFRASP